MLKRDLASSLLQRLLQLILELGPEPMAQRLRLDEIRRLRHDLRHLIREWDGAKLDIECYNHLRALMLGILETIKQLRRDIKPPPASVPAVRQRRSWISATRTGAVTEAEQVVRMREECYAMHATPMPFQHMYQVGRETSCHVDLVWVAVGGGWFVPAVWYMYPQW